MGSRSRRPRKPRMSEKDHEFLRGAQVFSAVPGEARSRLIACMTPMEVGSGQRFIRQGEEGDSLYLIREGSCVVKVARDGEEETVAVRKAGEVVGEMAIYTGERRMAHVDAETDMVVWRMSRLEFDQLCLAFPALREFVTRIVTTRLCGSSQTPARTIGRYTITDMIGEGDWTIVYRGVHEPLNMPVAIKMLKHTLAMDADFLQKFHSEAKVVSRFNHQNIVRVHDIEHLYRTVFVVMEYLAGHSLDSIIEKTPRLPLHRVLGLLIQIGLGLEYGHNQGIVHQALKPANVFVEEGDRAKIVDFGLAYPTGFGGNSRPVGTNRYMAPEQMLGGVIDERTDIYSLGVTAYEMATAANPFQGNDVRGIMKASTETPVPDPRLLNPDLPPEFSAFITRATRKDPSERYQTVGRALDELEHLAELHGLGGMPDIVDLRLTRKALQESEIRFKSIFMAAEDAIFIKDRNLKFTHLNPAMLRLVSVAEEDIVGRTHADVFESQSSAQVRQLEERVLSGESVETEQTISTLFGPVTLNFLRFPIFTDDGDVMGLCGIARDVTPRRAVHVKSRRNPDSYPSRAIRRVANLLNSAAETDATILFLGESGTGKDYLARCLHDKSRRAGGPFMAINCAALSPQLVESELFGYEKGAFTGAVGQKRGLLELAEGGTVFLNEIGELALSLQSKLLTFLDSQSLSRLGGERSITVNARVVTATNKDLKAEVLAGNFRKDLYFRLSVFPITVPPLRERIEDLALLVEHLIKDLTNRMTIVEPLSVSPSAIEKLAKYSWPGNIRELRNVLERAVIMSDKKRITSRDIKIMPDGEVSLTGADELTTHLRLERGGSLQETLRNGERALIEKALKLCSGNVTQAAKRIGLTREQLKYRIRSLEIAR